MLCYRKVKPSVPRDFWLDDCIMFCNKKTKCGHCKRAKQRVFRDKEKASKKYTVRHDMGSGIDILFEDDWL